MAVAKRTHGSVQDTKTEGAKMLQFLRALGTEDQRIAYAVLEGMQLQRKLDQQRELNLPAKAKAHPPIAN